MIRESDNTESVFKNFLKINRIIVNTFLKVEKKLNVLVLWKFGLISVRRSKLRE